jgi:hypothetical protein
MPKLLRRLQTNLHTLDYWTLISLPMNWGSSEFRVAVLQINLGDLQVHRRLLAGFIQRI